MPVSGEKVGVAGEETEGSQQQVRGRNRQRRQYLGFDRCKDHPEPLQRHPSS